MSTLVIPVNSSFPPLFAASRVYHLWYDGTNYHARDMNTGTDAYVGTVGSTVMSDVLNSSKDGAQIQVYVDTSVNLTGATSNISGSSYRILGLGGGAASQPSAPHLGTFNIGVSGSSTLIKAVHVEGVYLDVLQLKNYASITDIHFRDLGFREPSGAYSLILDTSANSANELQNIQFFGITRVSVIGAGFCHFVGGQATGISHLYFQRIETSGTASTAGHAMFYWDATSQYNRVHAASMDINYGGTFPSPGYICYAAANATATSTATMFTCDNLYLEAHALTYLVGSGSFSSTGLFSSTFLFKRVVLTFGDMAIFDLAGAKLDGSYGLFFGLESLVSSGTVTLGNPPPEVVGAGIYIGRAEDTGTTLDSGSTIATPVSTANNVLSLFGTGSITSGTTYTCGGTPLKVYVTGGSSVTVTVKSSTGTTLDAGNPPTVNAFELVAGMTIAIAWTSAPTITVVKAS